MNGEVPQENLMGLLFYIKFEIREEVHRIKDKWELA